MRIAVFGHVGNQNLGDEALIAAVLATVRRRYPEAELCGFTGRPHDTEARHGVRAFPIRRGNVRASPSGRAPANDHSALGAVLRALPLVPTCVRAIRRVARSLLAVPLELAFLARSYRRLRGTDLLLVAGSGQLNDYWGGPWGFPFTLFKWSVLARATGAKVVLLSLGAGPLRTWLGKLFIKQTLRLAQYRSYRDADSRQCALALGVPGVHSVVPDLVFGLPLAAPRAERASTARPIVGINPMPFRDGAYWPESEPRVFAAYLRALAGFADWLIDRGYGVRFFATQLLVDHPVIDHVRALMTRSLTRDGEQRVFAGQIQSFAELVAVLDAVDLVVATRYHGTLFGLLRGKPVLSIAYQQKSVELMTQVGQGRFAIPIDQVTCETLRSQFLALERAGRQFTTEVRRRLPAIREALETQYDRAFALLDVRAAVRGAGRTAPAPAGGPVTVRVAGEPEGSLL